MLELRDATVVLDGRKILDSVDLAVAEEDVAAVLGASGSGKSTLLRVIAGLLPGGTVRWRGRNLDGVPVHARPFGLMFQDHALFPHLNVGQNVAFGLEMTREPHPQLRVAEVLEMVGLAGFESRNPATLSGGESQRVALARALAPRPELLMLDEPLGSLDRTLRDRLLERLEGLLADLAITSIYVTHDHDEARTLADTVTILYAGRVLQSGPAEEVWAHPASVQVAEFLGYETTASIAVENGRWVTPWGTMPGVDLEPGVHEMVIPPHAVRFSPDGALTATVESHRFVGGRAEIRAGNGEGSVTGPYDGTPPRRGELVRFDIDPTAVHRF